MFCSKCGSDVGNAKFCPNCGAQISFTSASYQTNSTASVNNANLGWKKVNKIAYGILAILLGGLGVHRFYAGKILSGILYLLLCWTGIPGILGLIEGILALIRQDDDEHGNIYVDPGKFFV